MRSGRGRRPSNKKGPGIAGFQGRDSQPFGRLSLSRTLDRVPPRESKRSGSNSRLLAGIVRTGWGGNEKRLIPLYLFNLM